MKTPFDFGALLRELRKKRGYTQKRLAEVLNVSETTISKYESNTAVPPFETVRAIATWFNVPIDYLAGNELPLAVSLHGLSEAQTEIVKTLVAFYNEKNCSITNTSEDERYKLLGKIVASLV